MSNNLTHVALLLRSNEELDKVYRWMNVLDKKFKSGIPVNDSELSECTLLLERMISVIKVIKEKMEKVNLDIFRTKNGDDNSFDIPL